MKDHQTNVISSLVGIHQQRHDGSLGRLHPFSGGHRPTGIYDEQDRVGCSPNTDFLTHVLAFHDEPVAATVPIDLVGGGLSDGGVKRQVTDTSGGRPALCITSPFAAGACVASLAGRAAHQSVDGSFDASSLENLAYFDWHIRFDKLTLSQGKCLVALQDAASTGAGRRLRI